VVHILMMPTLLTEVFNVFPQSNPTNTRIIFIFWAAAYLES